MQEHIKKTKPYELLDDGDKVSIVDPGKVFMLLVGQTSQLLCDIGFRLHIFEGDVRKLSKEARLHHYLVHSIAYYCSRALDLL